MEPTLIALARIAAGLTQTQLAKDLGKSQPFVSQVEKGERDIPRDLLPRWCSACDIPESFLRSGRLPLDDSVAAMVHRKMSTLPAKPHNLANAQVKRRVLEIDALFTEIDIMPSLDIPRVPPGTGPADAAAYVRRAWRVPSGPLPNLVGLVESAGVPVVLMDCFHPKQSATAHLGRWFEWMIALNSSHPASRRRFTLAHELGHIVLSHETTVTTDEHERKTLEAQSKRIRRRASHASSRRSSRAQHRELPGASSSSNSAGASQLPFSFVVPSMWERSAPRNGEASRSNSALNLGVVRGSPRNSKLRTRASFRE